MWNFFFLTVISCPASFMSFFLCFSFSLEFVGYATVLPTWESAARLPPWWEQAEAVADGMQVWPGGCLCVQVG